MDVPGSHRSRTGREVARPARSGGRAIRILRQASSSRSASRARIWASERRTERSERPASSAISEICRPCSRSSRTRLPKGSRSEKTRSSSSVNARASSGVGSDWRPDEPSFVDLIERELDVDRAAVRALMPDLPEQLVLGDGGQQPPEVAAAAEGVAARSRLDEEASIDREHDVLGICPPRQTGREPAPGQRGEPLEVAGEERLRGQYHRRRGTSPAGRATSRRPEPRPSPSKLAPLRCAGASAGPISAGRWRLAVRSHAF